MFWINIDWRFFTSPPKPDANNPYIGNRVTSSLFWARMRKAGLEGSRAKIHVSNMPHLAADEFYYAPKGQRHLLSFAESMCLGRNLYEHPEDDNWMDWLLRRHQKLYSTVWLPPTAVDAYPDYLTGRERRRWWRIGSSHWRHAEPVVPRELQNRITEIKFVDTIFISKSTKYTPASRDKEFERFVEAAERFTKTSARNAAHEKNLAPVWKTIRS